MRSRIQLILPVGLEKLVAHDIVETWRRLSGPHKAKPLAKGLFPVFGQILTEIEAIYQLFEVNALHVGSGGTFGAEGSVTLMLEGQDRKVQQATQALQQIQGEPAF